MKNRTIKVPYLARVEGEGALWVRLKGDAVADVKLRIFEPPRFFEAFLRGRHYAEVPDLTARICGICPIAYQMSAAHAIEDAFGIKVEGQLRALRRLIYCGEWIESHVLHIAMLHAPDFLGYQDALQMAKDHPEVVQQALRLKKAGNAIVALIGGREIHPINVRVGGFYKVPAKRDLLPLREQLLKGRDEAQALVKWVAGLEFPEFERDYTFVALHHENEYPFNEGRLLSNCGLNIAIREYEEHFSEEQVAHSNALHSLMKGRGAYFVGPLARYNLNFASLSPLAREAAYAAGLAATCKNPFKGIIIRAIETLYAFDEAIRLIDAYETPEHPAIEIQARAAIGYGCSEAPRGICYHRYEIDERGLIVHAKIVPPTSQNQKTIEADLHEVVTKNIDLDEAQLTWRCEQAIRNYDPCISCATHFLRLKIERE